MSNLIRAEWYRLFHTGAKFYILGCMACIPLVFINESMSISLTEPSHSTAISMAVAVMLVCVASANSYGSRLPYYEIMNGGSPNSIILSKFAIYLPIVILVYYIPVAVLYLIFCGTKALAFLGLFLVIMLRYLIFGITVVMIFKSFDSSSLSMTRYVLEMLCGLNLYRTNAKAGALSSLLSWLPFCQFFDMKTGIDSTLAAKTIIGAAVECTVFYTLAYMSYKKKWSIRSTLL